MRIPLGGDLKARHELAAARLRRQQALVALKQIETHVANALHTAIQKALAAHEDIANSRPLIAYNEELLKTRLEQLKAGKVESRKVLEVEADLANARIALAEAVVRYQRALIELELVDGSLLRNRDLEISREQLEEATARLAQRGGITYAAYRRFLSTLHGNVHAHRIARP